MDWGLTCLNPLDEFLACSFSGGVRLSQLRYIFFFEKIESALMNYVKPYFFRLISIDFISASHIEKDPKYFNHTYISFSGSSDSPILNLSNHKLIGIQTDNIGWYFLNIFSVNSSSDKIDYEYELNICLKDSS